MMFGHRRHTLPELNTTSTADISFMLLIFFLVTTSMDIDKGLTRQLPPAEKQEQVETAVNKNKLMEVRITADNRVFIDNKDVKAKQVRPRVANFIRRLGPDHLITIDTDPRANYNTYFTLQNEMVAAYNQWRNERALQRYGRSYKKLTPEERNTIKTTCPMRIAEKYNGEKGGMQ